MGDFYLMGDFLYLTADKVGTPSGGGTVTEQESRALSELCSEHQGNYQVLSRDELLKVNNVVIWGDTEGDLDREMKEPWVWDHLGRSAIHKLDVSLAHVYAGTFGYCVSDLRNQGVKVTYTAAAHDISLSKREHEKLGLPYNYPHLTNPVLFEKYLRGYLQANVLICPSKHSADAMRASGATGRIEIIPHGISSVPDNVSPVPELFTVGYLGAVGPDKGLIYLLKAWKRLNYNMSRGRLVIAGQDSRTEYVKTLIRLVFDGDVPPTISTLGWVDNVGDFYNNISLYVQPSITEGFGIEVLEAMAYGRNVLCSTGAGAADVVGENHRFLAGNVDQLAECIDTAGIVRWHEGMVRMMQAEAEKYTWSKIREMYKVLWRGLLCQ